MPVNRGRTQSDKYQAFMPRLSVRSVDALSVRTLKPAASFEPAMIALAQDLAHHYVTTIGLSISGGAILSLSIPCLVSPPKKSDKGTTPVVGGLTTLFIGRTVSLDTAVYCQMLQRAPITEQLLLMERNRLLTVAPLYCRNDPEGAALLKRIWKFCPSDERADLFGVKSFKEFAARVNVKTARQAKAPTASTGAHYEPHEHMRFPSF